MSKTENELFCEVSLDQIVSPQGVIHPCLDWVAGQLIIGVNLKKNKTAVLSSSKGLVKPESLGPICPQGVKFQGAVSLNVAQEFVKYLQTRPEDREPANGKQLIADLASYLNGFVVFPKPWFPNMLALWILGTYLFPVFQTYPYLWITSPEPGCGKSLLGDIIAKLSFQGEFMTAPTQAQLFRLPETSRGVQVWDEVERKEETERQSFNTIQPVLLNGYRNGGAVPRQVGRGFQESAKFHVFCPRVLIGLTKLPEPARQRTITVQLVKRTSEQKIAHYIQSKLVEEERGFRERCLLWVLKAVDRVNSCYQDEKLRNELEALVGAGRASDDIWLPVFAVATAATEGERDELIETLKNAAKDLAEGSEAAATVDVLETVPLATQKQEREAIQRAALEILAKAVPVTPEQLAEQVGAALDTGVTAQKVSKSLKKIGIRACKDKGRRIFRITNEAMAAACRRLGIDRNGQQGQQQEEKG